MMPTRAEIANRIATLATEVAADSPAAGAILHTLSGALASGDEISLAQHIYPWLDAARQDIRSALAGRES